MPRRFRFICWLVASGSRRRAGFVVSVVSQFGTASLWLRGVHARGTVDAAQRIYRNLAQVVDLSARDSDLASLRTPAAARSGDFPTQFDRLAGSGSVLQMVFPKSRVEIHLFYNAIVFIPMIIGMYYHMFPPGRRPTRYLHLRAASPTIDIGHGVISATQAFAKRQLLLFSFYSRSLVTIRTVSRCHSSIRHFTTAAARRCCYDRRKSDARGCKVAEWCAR